MAETPKLGIIGQGWEVPVRVAPENRELAMSRCMKMGLIPTDVFTISSGRQAGMDCFTVIIPMPGPFYDEDACRSFRNEMMELHADVSGVTRLVPMVWRPEPEPCTAYGYLGICSICGVELPVLGPLEGEDKFLMNWHGNGAKPELLCGGTCRPPKGEVRRNYDGT